MSRFARLVVALVCAVVAPLAAQAPDQAPEIATTVAFTEGPTADRAGNIYFTDIINQRIMKLGTDGTLSVYREQSNAANGLVIDAQDRLIACEGALFERPGVRVQGKPRITRTDLKTGKVEILADTYMGKPFEGPNDATLDSKGRIYFTDLAGSAVYRLDPRPDGSVSSPVRLLAAPTIQRSNGIQVSPDDKKLYVIEANGAKGGARQVSAFDLDPDGNVNASSKKLHYNFSPGRSGDGMSIDTQGNLWVSAGMNQLRGTDETLATKTGIYVIAPTGALLKFIPIAEDFITNNTFAGPDLKTLYITAGKTLYKIRTDVAGLAR
jgi:gluconolactonase